MKPRLKKLLIALLILVLASAGGFYAYVSVYYRADASARAVLQTQNGIGLKEDHLVLSPRDPNDTALIFYPGAKVEYEAYLPMMQKITETSGITVILVKMPFNMAIFDSDAAGPIMDQYPAIKNWYLGGHSMGGAMASAYASKHPEEVKGLILLGAYLYGSYPAKQTLTIYGSFNTSVAEKVDYTENVIVIDGGNHAQFGNYGPQKGDPAATITSQQQQSIAAEAITIFLKDPDHLD